MTIQERKARESDLLRQQILAATSRVFAEQGYERVSMRKVAALIDYSPTTIYRFFKNKEELLQAIAAETYGGLSAIFEVTKANVTNDPLATLKSLVREYIVFCLGRPDMFRLFGDVARFEVEDGSIYECLGATRYRVYQSWLHCIEQSIQSGALACRDDRQIFFYLWDAADGYINHRIRFPGMAKKPPASDVDVYLDLVFRGIEAEARD